MCGRYLLELCVGSFPSVACATHAIGTPHGGVRRSSMGLRQAGYRQQGLNPHLAANTDWTAVAVRLPIQSRRQKAWRNLTLELSGAEGVRLERDVSRCG